MHPGRGQVEQNAGVESDGKSRANLMLESKVHTPRAKKKARNDETSTCSQQMLSSKVQSQNPGSLAQLIISANQATDNAWRFCR
jgi:hypothetical protein